MMMLIRSSAWIPCVDGWYDMVGFGDRILELRLKFGREECQWHLRRELNVTYAPYASQRSQAVLLIIVELRNRAIGPRHIFECM